MISSNKPKSLAFETKVWEKDWQFILKGDYLAKLIENCNYPFDNKQIIINNVKNRYEVEKECDRLVKEGVITNYYCVSDYELEVLDFFEITKESLGKGYVYSIAELTGIYVNKSEYLLHFSGDSFTKKNSRSWLSEAIHVLETHPNIVVANPTWNNKFDEVQRESESLLGNFYVGYGFSDQCYLIKNAIFKTQIYNFTHPESGRYPAYGGELFEKRVDAFMRTHGLRRITHRTFSYFSINFPKNRLVSLAHRLLSVNRL